MGRDSLGEHLLVTDEAMLTNIESELGNVSNCLGFSIQAVWNGDASGTLKLRASNNGTNWSDIPDSSVTITTGFTPDNENNEIWNIEKTFYNYVQLIWIRTSGNGTLNASLVRKG